MGNDFEVDVSVETYEGRPLDSYPRDVCTVCGCTGRKVGEASFLDRASGRKGIRPVVVGCKCPSPGRPPLPSSNPGDLTLPEGSTPV